MSERDVKVYACDWCKVEVSVNVIHHPAPFSLGVDTEPWDEAPLPKGWIERHEVARVMLCTECRTQVDDAITRAVVMTKKERER